MNLLWASTFYAAIAAAIAGATFESTLFWLITDET
jgi:hypothetical protein